MISSATAMNVVQSEATTTLKKDVYVEPNIRLTRSNLPLLKRSLNQIKDLDYKYVLQQIIKVIKEKGIADSNSIREILLHSGTDIKDAYSACKIYAESNGEAHCFPGLIRSALFGFFSKGTILKWYGDNNYSPYDAIYVKINNKEYTTKHEGIAIGYFGIVNNKMRALAFDIWYTFSLGTPWRSGFALLAFVKY